MTDAYDAHPFPTDEMTLRHLITACEMNPDTGRTHLHDFLNMGTVEKSQTDISDEFEEGGAPVYFVEYEEGKEPFSEQHVIVTLARELLATRESLAAKKDSA